MNIKMSPLRFCPLVGLALVIIGLLSACDQTRTKQSNIISNNKTNTLVGVNYNATDRLLRTLKKELDPNKVIIVASFVNIDDLSESSTLGRISAEQFSSKLSQNGYIVNELKLRREGLFIKEQAGEFMLSRELKDIAFRHTAQAILVGTYGVGRDAVYISVKMVNPEGLVIASTDYSIKMTPGLYSLISNDREHP